MYDKLIFSRCTSWINFVWKTERRGSKKFPIADRNKIALYSAECNSCAQQRFRSRMLGQRRFTSHAWIRLIKWNCPSAVLRRGTADKTDRLRDRQTVSAWRRTGGGEPSRIPPAHPPSPSSLEPREDRKDDKALLNSLTVVTIAYYCVSCLESAYTIIWSNSLSVHEYKCKDKWKIEWSFCVRML